MKELIFQNTSHEFGGGRIDGPCKLPSSIDWPSGNDGIPLFHLLSVPFGWIEKSQDNDSNWNKWISVFISYDKKDYSHYGKMSSDDLEHTDAAVILHDMTGPEKSMHPNQAKISKNIKTVPATEGDDNVASYIESTPTWVQDPIDLEGYRWVFSVYGPDMDKALGDNRGILSDGVGYAFIRSEIDNFSGPVGKFFLQL